MIENTATSRYWLRKHVTEGRALCSQCDPEIGRWHGYFPRVYDETWAERSPGQQPQDSR